MKTIEDVEGVRQRLTDDFEVGAPHVGADVLDKAALFGIETLFKPVAQAGFIAVSNHSEEAAGPVVDLIDQGHVAVAFGVGDFIDPYRCNALHIAMGETVLDNPLHAAKYVIPFGMKHACAVFPAKQAGPLGQKDTKIVGEAMFASCPRNDLGSDAITMPTVHAAHAVVKAHRDVPKGNVIESPGIFCGVVGGTGFVAAAAYGPGVFTRHDGDFDELLGAAFEQSLALCDFNALEQKSLDRA